MSSCWLRFCRGQYAKIASTRGSLKMLLRLDERDDLCPEEKALAEVLTLLIQDYEEKPYPMPRVSPNESLRALMDDRGFRHKDIWPVRRK